MTNEALDEEHYQVRQYLLAETNKEIDQKIAELNLVQRDLAQAKLMLKVAQWQMN